MKKKYFTVLILIVLSIFNYSTLNAKDSFFLDAKKLFENKKYEKIEMKKLKEYAVPKIIENYLNQNISIHRL